MSFETQLRRAQGVAIIDLSGALKLGSPADTLRTVVATVIAGGESRIVLNCAGVTQVDSAGVGELMSCHSAAARHGAVLKLAGVRDRLANLIKLTGLDAMIESFSEEETALASFSGG